MNEFFDLLQRASIFGVAALLVALLLQWILSHRVPARWRVWVWRVALIQTALALIPFPPISLSVLPARAPVAAPKVIEAPAVQAPIVADVPAVAASPDMVTAPAELSPPAIIEAPTIQSAPVAKPRYLIDINSWDDVAICIYLLGVAFQLALLARNIVRVRRALRVCTPLDNAVLRPIAARLKIRRLPRLLQNASGSPFLVGIMRPTIVVPQTLNPAHLEAVFAHELAHLRRRDLAWNALLWALQTALWFHPLSWFCRRFHALEVESACDELTLQLTPIAPRSYGALLIGADACQPSPLTAGVSDHFFALQTRLKRLGRAPMQPRRRAAWLLSGALLFSFCAVVPLRLTARAQIEPKVAKLPVGLIHGIVTYKGSTVPLGGQIVQLRDSKGKLTQTKTNAQGKFLLRANAGKAMLWLQRDNKIASPDLFKSEFSFVNSEIKTYSESAEEGFHWGSTATAAKLTITPQNHRDSDKNVEIEAANVIFLPVKINAKREIEIETSIKPASIGETGRLTGKISLPNGQRANATVFIWPATSPNFTNSVNSWTDANRSYSIEGLKPGEYKIAVSLDDKLAKVWAAPPTSRKMVKAGTNRADFKLSRGALIEGVVISKASKKPLKGIEVMTADSNGNGILRSTDARGQFQFRVAPGRIGVRIHKEPRNVTIHVYDRGAIPRSFILSSNAPWMFNLKDGDKRKIQFELPKTIAKTPTNQDITGLVVGPDGKPVAGADVGGQALEFGESGWNTPVKTDANGRFRIAERSANLFARKGDLTTARGTFAFLGDDVQLELESNVYARVEGQITDRTTGQPIADAKVWYSTTRQMTYPRQVTTLLTDAQGRFRFAKLRPFEPNYFTVTKNGYQKEFVGTFVLQKGETKRAPLALKPLSQTLSGRILLPSGQPAGAGFLLLAGTADPREDSQETKTRADGSFYFPNVLDEKLQISVIPPAKGKYWGPFWTRGGRSHATFQLTDARLTRANPAQNRQAIAQERALRQSQPALVGTPAPPFRVRRWIVGNTPTFAGQVTLLYFVWLNGHPSALDDFARSFQSRGVQVVSIEQLRPFWDVDMPAKREQYLVDRAREMGVSYPVAIDAPLPKRNGPSWLTGQSHKLYRGARYVIVGRDGKIKWVGNEQGQAIAKTAELAR